MNKLQQIKNNEKEVAYFSLLVHNYHKLTMMRVMQHLRERWGLTGSESQELIISIIGRMVNEGAYSLHGIMHGSGMRVEDILPKTTIDVLKEALLHGNVVDPTQRKDINVDISEFKKFIKSIHDKEFEDLSIQFIESDN